MEQNRRSVYSGVSGHMRSGKGKGDFIFCHQFEICIIVWSYTVYHMELTDGRMELDR